MGCFSPSPSRNSDKTVLASSQEADLLGPACQAELLTVAKLTRESTNEIEAGHSGLKKRARRLSDLGRPIQLHEQSALRMIEQLQGAANLHAYLWADLAQEQQSEEQQPLKSRSNATGQPGKKQRKRRKINAYQAFTATHVQGRLANKDDAQRYRQLSVPEKRKFQVMAHAMTQRRRAMGGTRAKRRRNDPMAWHLRKKRRAARRLQRDYDPKESRRTLQKDRADLLLMRWEQISSQFDAERRESRQSERESRKHFLSHVNCNRELWPLDPLGDYIYSWRIKAPPACSDAHTPGSETLFAQHTWMSKGAQEAASVHAVAARTGDARVSEWERRHAVLEPVPGVKLPKESDAARAARATRQAGLVLSSHAQQLSQALATVLMNFAGQGVKQAAKVKSKQRLLLEENHVVLELQQTLAIGGTRRLWYQICYLTYDRPVRASFMALEEDVFLGQVKPTEICLSLLLHKKMEAKGKR